MTNRRHYIQLLAVATAGFTSVASASGLMRDETASSYMATAGAGHAADISASAAFNNPAGLTYLDKPEVQGNLLLIEDSFHFYDQGSTGSNADFDNRRKNVDYGAGLQGGGSLFYGQPLSEKWGIGFALASPAGGATDPGNNWVGSNFIESIEVLCATAQLSLGYRINERWSVGASLGISYMSWELDIDPFSGASENIALDGTEPVWTIGLMYQPYAHTRLGLHYVAGIDHDLSGEGKTTPPAGSGSTRVTQVFPLADMAVLSLDHQLTPKLSLLADLEWVNWSDWQESVIDHEDGPYIVVPRNWRDTWGGAIGLSYQLSPSWAVKAGIAYDESAVSIVDHKLDPPVDRRLAYAAGVNWRVTADTEFNLGYEYLDFGDMKINQSIDGFDPIAGAPYQQTIVGQSEGHVHIVSLGLTSRF